MLKNYVLVPDKNNILCPHHYTGNVFLIRDRGESYRYYLVENADGSFDLYNTDPNERVIYHKVRCPRCSSQLVNAKNRANKYRCLICDEKPDGSRRH
jgi:ssDNA-binding Zn-finger/Zn-ribbon topoisomerase 1